MRRTLAAVLAATMAVGVVGCAAPASSPAPELTQRDAAILLLDGDYLPQGGHGLGVLTQAQWDALLPVYRAAEETGLPCRNEALTLMRTGDYRPDMRPCFGDEDSPAVDVLLTMAGHPAPASSPATVTVTVTADAPAPDARHWTDGMAVCLSEDGSDPGQEFPCRWEAANQGNGRGDDFTLTGPAS